MSDINLLSGAICYLVIGASTVGQMAYRTCKKDKTQDENVALAVCTMVWPLVLVIVATVYTVLLGRGILTGTDPFEK